MIVPEHSSPDENQKRVNLTAGNVLNHGRSGLAMVFRNVDSVEEQVELSEVDIVMGADALPKSKNGTHRAGHERFHSMQDGHLQTQTMNQDSGLDDEESIYQRRIPQGNRKNENSARKIIDEQEDNSLCSNMTGTKKVIIITVSLLIIGAIAAGVVLSVTAK